MADALVKAEGVSRVEFDPAFAMALVSYDRQLASPETIISTLNTHTAYHAVVMEDP